MVAITKTLIQEQKRRIAFGEKIDCYLDLLLSEGRTLTDHQLHMLIWEAIIEASDTTLVTTEWAMYELAKNPKCQERLYWEIHTVCWSEKLAEDHLPQLPYLRAIFHEIICKHCPVPIIPLRYAHEDTEHGRYHIPAGTENLGQIQEHESSTKFPGSAAVLKLWQQMGEIWRRLVGCGYLQIAVSGTHMRDWQ